MRNLELNDARNSERIEVHDRVIEALKDNLDKVVERFRSLETRVTILIVVLVLSSPQGQDLLGRLGLAL